MTLFLGQVIDHLDQYVHLYTSQWAMVMAMAAVENEAADWVADLYSEHGQDLGNASLFFEALHERFEDHTRAQRVEGEMGPPAPQVAQPEKMCLSSQLYCFQLGKPDHWAAECTAPAPKTKIGQLGQGTGTLKKMAKKTPEKSRGAQQAEAVTPVGTADESRLMVDGGLQLDSCDSDDYGEVDPMVSMAIWPFWLLVVLMVQCCWFCNALIDLGCIQCLMSLATAPVYG